MGYRGVPLVARATFRNEIIAGSLAAAAGGAVAPEFTQLFALKTLGASDWIMPVLVAQVAFANLLGAFTAQHLQRRKQIPLAVAARAAIAVVLAVLAVLPADGSSLAPFVLLLILPPVLAAVALNIQSRVWHSNYPPRERGRIFARLAVPRLLAMVAAVKLAGYALDAWPGVAHHGVYAASALLMAASAWYFGRIRMRGQRALLRHGQAQPLRLLGALHVLREDKAFAQYMLWQMVSGGSLLLTAPLIVPALTRAFPLSYAQGTTVLFMAPLAMQLLAAPLAGKLFDSVGIMRYRAINATLWAISRGLLYVAIVAGNWTMVILAALLQGVAQSSGDVVWHIGHTRFAGKDRGQLYMGLHMSLQGLRGLTLPFLGAWLYQIDGIGLHVMAAAVALQLFAAVEFLYSKAPVPSVETRDSYAPSESRT
jgi:hypothetical protein